MKRSYPVPTTIDLDDADFDRILENFEHSLYEYLDDEYMIWSQLDRSIKDNIIQAIFKDVAQQILNKDLT